LVTRLHRSGPEGNLELAFEARMKVIERAWRMHLDEILYPQSEALDARSLTDALEQPDLDRGLGSPPEFNFDPTRPRRSGRSEIQEIDDEGRDPDRDDHADGQAERRADPW